MKFAEGHAGRFVDLLRHAGLIPKKRIMDKRHIYVREHYDLNGNWREKRQRPDPAKHRNDPFPIVTPELDSLALQAFYLLKIPSICSSGDPQYAWVDQLVEAQVLDRYPELLWLLVERSHTSATGHAMAFNPHHRRATCALFACESLHPVLLDSLDKKIVKEGTAHCVSRVCEKCRIKIAARPEASPSLWNRMLSRHEPTEELIETIERGWSVFDIDYPDYS